MSAAVERWPALPLAEWQDTYATLHMWTQIVGKTRLALAPMENHWWNVTLHLTARGLTTTPMPHGQRTFSVYFDFLNHELNIRVSDGSNRSLSLRACSVADFYREYMAALDALGLHTAMLARPVEVVTAIPFADDGTHAAYDPDAAQRWWRATAAADQVFKRFRGRFQGKQSPSHFFWGSFDLATTRFSGRPAPTHPGGAPHCADWVMVEAYTHECASAGFWPGSDLLPEPAFYAYAYPEPAGYPAAPVRPEGAYYHPELREFVLPYERVRTAAAPDESLLEFLETTYAAAADLAAWDRAALDRPRASWP